MEKDIESTEESRRLARASKVKEMARERQERERRQREADHLARSQAERSAREAAEKADAAERQQFHGDAWGMLVAWQRAFALLAVAVAESSPELAASIRATLAASLSGADVDFPHAEWFAGVQLGTLSDDRKTDLLGIAKKEAEVTALAAIPAHELLRLKLICASDPAAMIEMWRIWRKDRAKMKATR